MRAGYHARMKAFLPRLALLLGLSVPCAPALAWAALGHPLIGELAQRHLTPAASAQVSALLAGQREPTLAGVAYWADALRSQDPATYKRTAPWHYLNAKGGGCDFQLARDCPDGNCVVGAIEKQRAILADASQPREARRDALKFIVHFVGDVHQPMHASSHTDAGGNGFQVSLRTDLEPEAYARKQYVDGIMGTNLHSVWDYYILGEKRLGVQAYAERLDALPWPPMGGGPPSPPLAWATESCRLVDARKLYPDSHKMDRGYMDAMRPLAEQRLRQAAYRLATLLNDTLGNQGAR